MTSHPIFVREMRASMRLLRTPWLIMALVLIVTLALASAGALATADHTNPAELGQGLFQAFFSAGFFVVIAFGPAMSSNLIAGEREGKTWEALMLSGLRPERIAKEAFLTGVSRTGAYVVALAPVSALAFLFGGVSAIEVFFGFVVLALLACLASLFGTAMSAMFQNHKSSTLATLALGILLGGALFGIFGSGASVAVHSKWQAVPEGLPIWLPLAWSRASFGLDYLLLLVVMPFVFVGTVAWFLYEITVANLREASDDKSSGIRRWFLVSTPAFAFACLCPLIVQRASGDSDRLGLAVLGASGFFVFAFVTLMVLGGEPLHASRRVVAKIAKRSSTAGFFVAPGLVRSLGLFTVVSLLTVGVMSVASLAIGAGSGLRAMQMFSTFTIGAAFLALLIGMVAALRARGASPVVTRIITLATLFVLSVVPFILMGIVKAATSAPSDDVFWIAAPSPFYAGALLDGGAYAFDHRVAPAIFWVFVWTALGAALFGYARSRSRNKGAA